MPYIMEGSNVDSHCTESDNSDNKSLYHTILIKFFSLTHTQESDTFFLSYIHIFIYD